MSKTVVILAVAGALAFAISVAHAAPQTGAQPAAPAAKPEAAAPPAPESETKPEAGEAKPGETAPPAAGTTEPPQPETAPASLAELTKDGFEIRTTAFIPADAVTRQSGKVSSDAIVVTLQKTAATAVCFYTLKAYVSRKLTTIPACTVHR
jgi:hypothetical protein